MSLPMPANLMKTIKQRLLNLSTTNPLDLQGASEEEIQTLERYAGGTFPQVYRDFLTAFGRSAGPLFQGTESSLSDRMRLRLRKSAEAIVSSSGSQFEIPEMAFVFLMAQGYQFSYFLLADGEDPPVFHYLEGEPGPTRLAERLSDYYLECVEQYENWVRRLKETSTT